MSKIIQRFRAAQTAQARHTKTRMLPVPRATADDLALKVHLALDIMRRRQGCRAHAQTLLQMTVLAGYLVDRGYGLVSQSVYEAADAALGVCFERGHATGEWFLDEKGFRPLAQLVTVYDDQVHHAPLAAITDASDRLDHLAASQARNEAAQHTA
jgi:hypothetical protein